MSQPRAGTPVPAGTHTPPRNEPMSHPPALSRSSYPARGSSRGPSRPRARLAGRPAARSRRPACFLVRGAAGGGAAPQPGPGGGGAGAPRAVAVRLGLGTDCERSARRGSSRCRRDFPLARDAEQRAVLATAKHLRNRCRSSSWQPRLAVTKAGLGWRNRPALGATGGGDFLQPQHT